MHELLSKEWAELYVELGSRLPVRTGATARIRYAIAEPKRDDLLFDLVFTDGRVVAAELGAESEPDVVVSATWGVYAATVTGELDAQAALMQGKLKASMTGPLLPLLPVLQSAEWHALEGEIAARTKS